MTAVRGGASEAGGRVVLVTGGSLGIGKEIARAFGELGDRLVLCARGAEALEEAATELRAVGVEVEAVVCDVADDDSVRDLVDGAIEGQGRVDVLVNNAGIYGPIGPLADNDIEAWCRTIDVNLLGVMRVTRRVLPHMMTRGGGVILNLSGGGATGPKPGYSAYAASKTAVVRLTEVLAHELAPHSIRVNAIAPGFIPTRLHEETLEAGRLAPDHDKVRAKLEGGGDDPRLAAELATFLASEKAARITGRLISSVWDDWGELEGSGEELEGSDLFTLRRIDNMFFREVPRE